MSFTEENWGPGMMDDVSDEATARYVSALYNEAMRTNKPEDWASAREALERYRDPPPAPKEGR
jgi:hypothetical protein